MVIVKVTKQNGPHKIRKSGLVTSVEMITGLAEMGVQELKIDPQQTVEIEQTVPRSSKSKTPKRKSRTQQLLESDDFSRQEAEDGLSDQFNRSLFLPSVQELPSRWHYYSKRIATIVLIMFGGFALGWSVSNYHLWHIVQQENVVETENKSKEFEQVSTSKNTSETNEVAIIPQEPAPPKLQLQTLDSQASFDSVLQKNEEPTLKSDIVPDIIEFEAPANISPELLKRFEQAISQLDSEPEPEQQFIDRRSEVSDVPRIDQLPAWVMTELPNMAFSAHMYASDKADRWVRVNGNRLVEGDVIDGKVRIIDIAPQHLILVYQNHEFSMAALTDW